MIEAIDLKKQYPVARGVRALFARGGGKFVSAVDGVSFSVPNGQVLGIVGESGCGKSTLAKMLVGLESPSAGTFEHDGEDGTSLRSASRREFYRRIQMVFQDPYGSLNPSHDVFTIVSNPLVYQGVADRGEIRRRVLEAMDMVGLKPAEMYLGKHPHLLSGGQRQRLCIARALILGPSNLIADEPVSMLDVSIKWDIIRLLKMLVKQRNLSLVYITHDLATVSTICDRLAVMYLGKIVETGPARDILLRPAHPYTKALVSAIPRATFDGERAPPEISGALADAIDLPLGCRFQARCPRRTDQCAVGEPLLENYDGRDVACVMLDRSDQRSTLEESGEEGRVRQ